MKKELKSMKGITLIALVITIIVLLILAGVTIATLTGDNGILTKTQVAKENTEEAQNIEKIRLAVSEAQIEKDGYKEVNQKKLQEAMDNQFGKGKVIVTDDGNDTFIVNILDNGDIYNIGNTVEKVKVDLYISNAQELKAFRDQVNNGNTFEGKVIQLTDNISLNDNENWQPIGLYPNNSPSPNSDLNTPFKGIFNGSGHEINGIYINTSDKAQGLFGLVENGKIINLGIGSNNNIVGGSASGGICGYLYNGGVISNCYNKSNIQCSFGGGIVGCSFNNCFVMNCYNIGAINGNNSTGGIVGINNEKASIKNCYNNGNIQATGTHIGGISGQNQNNSTIEKCYNNASIKGKGYCGGIAGSCYYSSIINLCYNSNQGNVQVINECIGGIVGKNFSDSIINNCYNKAYIQNEGNITGGIIGIIEDAEIYNCYNTGNVESVGNQVGGIIGKLIGETKINNNYYSEDIVNNGYDISITGIEIKAKNEMKKLYTLLGSNWKEDKKNVNEGYPLLYWQ